jgi:hypothetical protein
MMGHIVDPDRLFGDMEQMGIQIKRLVTDKDAR